jgi:hypothetical protein
VDTYDRSVSLASKGRYLAIPVALVFLAVVMAFAGSPSARATTAPASAAATSLSVEGRIYGISGTSAANVWAVGVTGDIDGEAFRTLIAHWNGRRWTVVHDFSPLGQLTAISTDSPADAWALGQDNQGNTFIIHWNGRTWSKDSSVPHVAGYLYAIVAVDGDVWVVGQAASAKTNAAVMLHRTAGHWYVVPIPAKATTSLSAFAASSRSSIWVGGAALMHWNGAEWKATAMPKVARWVQAMSPGPHGSVWAVGGTQGGYGSLHWNGKAWSEAPIPGTQNDDNMVNSIGSIPGGTAWAVGTGDQASGTTHPALILHWSGKAWKAVKTPATAQPNDQLVAVSAISSNDAWAAGWSTCIEEHCPVLNTLILHWNGKAWS